MSKFLMTAAEVVGGVALIASGIGAAASAGLLSATVFGSATAATLSTIATVAKVAGVAAAVIGVGAQLTAKKPSDAGNPDSWRANPDQGIDLPLGDCYNSGGVIYRQTYGKKNKYETLVTSWGLGPVGGINTTYVDGIAYDVFGGVVQIADRGNMYQATQLGLCPEAGILNVGPVTPYGWTAQCKLSGKAAIMNTFVYDAKGSVTFTSIPNCGWRGHGKLAYDPRLDDTYPGGAGPQRSNDETTWQWTRNPFLVALAFLLGWHQNGKLAAGAGIPITGIMVDQLVEGANVADANKWYVGGVKSTSDNPWDVYTDILQAGGAEPLELGAKVGCLVNMPRVRLATFDRNWLANGSIVIPKTTSRRDRINSVTPTYLQETSVVTQDSDDNLVTTVTWANAPGPPIIAEEYVTADGKERRKPISYPLVQCFAGDDPTQVAQLARYDIENAREISGITIPCKLRAYGYKPGDCVGLQLPEAGASFADRDILLMQRSLEPGTCVVTMTARTETADKHAKALGQTTSAPTTPAISPTDFSAATPTAGIWTATGTTLSSASGAIPALVVGVAPGVTSDALDDELSGVDGIIFEYRVAAVAPAAAGPWMQAGAFAATVQGTQITSVASGGVYDLGICYRSRGIVGPPLIIPNLTAGQLATPGSLAALINGSKPSVGATPTAAIDANGTTATISIPAHTRIYSDKSVAVSAGTVTGVALNTYYVIFYDDPTRSGGAVTYQASTDPDDALITPANPGRHYFGDITTPAAGSMGGSTGGGANGPGGIGGGACPQEDEPILLANADRTGPGETIRAGDLRVDMWAWTRHEHSGEWGAFRVSRAARVESDLWSAPGCPRTSPSHLFWEGAWTRMDAIGVADGRGWVVQITVEDAHTYIAGGRLSHNKTTQAQV